ncbi:MAG: VPLPA-CTERM sorting domain-containing protein [Pseudomonadota bacterium]
MVRDALFTLLVLEVQLYLLCVPIEGACRCVEEQMRCVAVVKAALAVFFLTGAAHAASISNHAQLGCPSFTMAHVSQVDCSQSFVDISQTDAVFGKTGWKMVDLGLTTDGTFTGGTWQVIGYSGYDHVMMTIEGGGSYIAGLLDTSSLSGTWSGPDADVSFKLYAVSDVADVPLPASGLLLLSAVALMGAARRRHAA